MGRVFSRTRSSAIGVALAASGTAAVAVTLIVASGAAALGAAGSPGTRANPYPRGQKALVEKFAISVVGVDTNAWPKLRRASPRNVAPALGTTYVLVTMRAKNQGRDEGIPLVDGMPTQSAAPTGFTARSKGAARSQTTSRISPESRRGTP